MNRRRTALVAAALVVAAGPALAGKSFGSSASLTGVGFSLIDLMPGDGIAPSATFLPQEFGAFTEAKLAGSRGGDSEETSMHNGGSGGSLFSSLTGPVATASTALLLSGGVPTAFSAGMATPGGGRFDAYSTGMLYSMDIYLSPHTAMVWTGNYAVDAWANPGKDRWNVRSPYAHVTFGRATFSVQAYADPIYGAPSAHLAGSTSFTLTNDTAGFGTYSSSFGIHTNGGWVSPVPEPGTYALFAAGLLAVGVVAKRRGEADRSA